MDAKVWVSQATVASAMIPNAFNLIVNAVAKPE
jgi:hypothetical protein